MRLLACDIGNSSTSFGLYINGKLVRRSRVPTGRLGRAALPALACDAAAIASVVPSAVGTLKRRLRSKYRAPVLVIGRDARPPIVNRYHDPRQVGTDRLMSGLAFFHKYKKAGIVIDFGTAVTFDAVSSRGEYLGGAIAPGIETALEALYRKTALLPRIRLTHPTGIIGSNTVDSIRSGTAFGIGGLCDRIVELLKRRLGSGAIVVATGGNASFMRRYCRSIKRIEPDLVLEGIYLTAKKSLDKKASTR